MTRDEIEFLAKHEMFTTFSQAFLNHDAEQRLVIKQQAQQIFTLKSELSHWTWVRFKQLEEENATLREALQGILEIGKRDMTNPKYDGYFEKAQQALKEQP